MTGKEYLAVWAFSIGYTAYVVAIIFGSIALLGSLPGGLVGLVLSLLPLAVGGYVLLVRT